MRPRKPIMLALQVALAALVVWFAWRSLSPELDQFGAAWSRLRVRPLLLAASGLTVFANYALLIQTWRRVVLDWGGTLPFGTAARIWLISNLGKWVPGKVWQIAAMGAMAQRAGVAATVAVGSSLYIAVINVIAGFAVCLLCAPNAFAIPPALVATLGVAAAAFVLTPRAIPAVVAWVARRIGRELNLAPLRYRTVALTFLSCAAAWVIHGIAFQMLAAATMGNVSGATLRYVALFTSSYLVGYLALFAAGGIGVRESMMIAIVNRYGLMTAAEVAVLSIVSRIWLTVLELLPGLVLLVFSRNRPITAAQNARTP